MIDPFKTAALASVAVMLCLLLLLTPEPRQIDTGEQVARMGAGDRPGPVEPVPVRIADQPAASKSERNHRAIENSIPVEETVPLETAALVLYPELEWIRESEDLPTYQAILELQPLAADPDPVIRLAAIESLGDMDDPATLPSLLAALNDPVPQLRVAALGALASQEIESAAGSIAALLYDPDREVRLAAIEAMADLESDIAVHALSSLLTDPDPLIRNRAVNALGDIGGKDVRAYLVQARYDPEPSVRINAESILAELDYDAIAGQ